MPRQPQSARPRKKPTGDYHHGDLRRALIDAAVDVIGRDGAAALSLRALARAVGVSTAAPYRHFPSREALLAAVAEDGFRALARHIAAATARHPDEPVVRLREAGVAYVQYATRHPAHYAVMFSAELVERAPYPDLREAAAESFSHLAAAIADGQAAGLLRPDDPARVATLAWSIVHGLSSLVSSGQASFLGVDPSRVDDLGRYIAERLIVGIGAPDG